MCHGVSYCSIPHKRPSATRCPEKLVFRASLPLAIQCASTLDPQLVGDSSPRLCPQQRHALTCSRQSLRKTPASTGPHDGRPTECGPNARMVSGWPGVAARRTRPSPVATTGPRVWAPPAATVAASHGTLYAAVGHTRAVVDTRSAVAATAMRGGAAPDTVAAPRGRRRQPNHPSPDTWRTTPTHTGCPCGRRAGAPAQW